jgi:hypothetical protein
LIFYQPYVIDAQISTIRVLYQEQFYQTDIKRSEYNSAIIPFENILECLQNRITDPQTTVRVTPLIDDERMTLTVKMCLTFTKVIDCPFIEEKVLLFKKYKSDSEKKYEIEIKRQKCDNEALYEKNQSASLQINQQMEEISNLKHHITQLEDKLASLKEKQNQTELHNLKLTSENAILMQFRDTISRVFETENRKIFSLQPAVTAHYNCFQPNVNDERNQTTLSPAVAPLLNTPHPDDTDSVFYGPFHHE